MTSIIIDNFTGEFPKADIRLLPENGAQTAINCDLRSGKIVPEYEDLAVDTISTDTKTMYLDGSSWKTWSNLTYYFNSPFAKETLGRFYTLQYEEGVYHPMQYEGTNIALQDLTFQTAEETIVAVAIDRTDTSTSATTITCKGSTETISEEQSGDSIIASFDTAICVGSANPSSNTINGDTVAFDYSVNRYTSADSGVTYTLDSTSTGSYSGNVLYAGGTSLYINPAITHSFTSTGATFVKAELDVGGETITMEATGSVYPPAGEILDRYYMWAYVYVNGEEGPPSPISNLATIYKGDEATLSNIGLSTVVDEDIVSKRIYTTSGGSFKLLGEIDALETTFTDNVATTGLVGEMLVANNPENMQGMVLSPLGFTIGWDGKDVLFANEYLPYAWDDSVSITARDSIVGMVPVNDITYVLTDGHPCILSGFTIDSMSLEEIAEPQSCVSRTGFVRYKNSAYYISPDGIVQLSGGNSVLFTRPYFNKLSWEMFDIENGVLVVHDDVLHFISSDIHYKFSLAEETILTQGEARESVVFQDIKTDSLYYKRADEVYKYRAGTTKKTATWRSREEDFKTDIVMGCGRVHADSYDDLTFNVYGDGELISSTVVLSNKPFRLANKKRAMTYSMETVGTDTVSTMQIAQTMREIK